MRSRWVLLGAVDHNATLELRSINCIRGLAIDAVERAKSGHPGLPLGCAPLAVTLWRRHMRHNPGNPMWFNRDRFVLSAGHGSMLLYGMLFATGYDLTIEDLKAFRQWESRTPGHPENFMTPGVEMTTGPLGQGIATAVGMAIAEEHLAAKFNRTGHTIVDHYTYVIASDGDLMEGVAQEACSLAGHLGLSKLVVIYDSNRITIDGSTDDAFTENTAKKFDAMGWQIVEADGMDPIDMNRAILVAKAETRCPCLIIARTVIGFGSPNKAGSSKSHGSPLGADEAKMTKAALGLPEDEEFYFPDDVRDYMDMRASGAAHEDEWNDRMAKYSEAFPAEASLLRELMDGGETTDVKWPEFSDPISNRVASGKVQNAINQAQIGLLGGSADLTDNVMTRIDGSPLFSAKERGGQNIAFGVREHGMAAIANGITMHGATQGFAGTFLIFSDYCRPSIRLAALMRCPSIFVFSHDSIGLGEDGPTHQPIEQVMSLRMIPNLNVMRPADANETAACWKIARESRSTPSVIVTTRQNLPVITPPMNGEHPALSGGYVLRQESGPLELVLVATGSEVSLAAEAAEQLGAGVRVVSLPSWFLFDQLDSDARESVLPRGVPTLSVEAGTTLGWQKYADTCVGIDTFGSSAPGPELFRRFGFTVENIVAKAQELLNAKKK